MARPATVAHATGYCFGKMSFMVASSQHPDCVRGIRHRERDRLNACAEIGLQPHPVPCITYAEQYFFKTGDHPGQSVALAIVL